MLDLSEHRVLKTRMQNETDFHLLVIALTMGAIYW